MVATCKKACKKKRSTMLTVEQMVDIALGTPEIGAVNFNVLHALIHVIIQQLNIQKCLVEFKGYDSDRMEGIIMSAKPGPILKLSEYMIDISDGKPITPKEKSKRKEGEEDTETPYKKPLCECTGKRRKNEDWKEKSDKEKDESDVESKKQERKVVVKKEPLSDDDLNDDEPEPKKVRETKKKCPCNKGEKKEGDEQGADENVGALSSSYYGSDNETCQTIVRVEPIGEKCDSWRSRPALAHESMVKLEEKVAMLQDAFEALEKMPTNEELKKRACKDGGVAPTPVKDLWQIYNLNKRVESCEGTIEKLASMIEDLVKDTCNYREAMLVIADAVDEMECADEVSRSCCAALQGRYAAPLAPQGKTPKSGGQNVSFAYCPDGKPCDEARKEADAQAKPIIKAPPGSPTVPRSKTPTPAGTPAQPGTPMQPGTPLQMATPAQSVTPNATPTTTRPSSHDEGVPMAMDPKNILNQEEQLESRTPREVAPLEPDTGTLPPPPYVTAIGPEFFKMSTAEKFCVLKEHVDCLTCQIKNFTENPLIAQLQAKLCAMVSAQKQLDILEKEWKEFSSTFGEEGVTVLNSEITNSKNEVENLNALISKLTSDKQDMENTIKFILQEMDNLKRVKADMEVVEDLLAGKADSALVNKKVSHAQFDAACDDLTRGLDEALEKLMQQEAMWNEAMDELQKELETKLDKIEIMPLKEFINKKLKCLQEKLKQLAQLRKDAEAAGAKSRILRNLNCIACDNDVVMKMDNRSNYQSPGLTTSKSIKPMLTYELDQVRKAMKKGPCKATHHVEEAIADVHKKGVGLPLTTREAVDNKISKLAHFCSRYCGGSHTITTPQQRVTRIGHFLTEFGPQAMAMFSQEMMAESKSTQPGFVHSGAVSAQVEISKPC